ncbi:unnamed protein product [Arabidopsis halleri]
MGIIYPGRPIANVCFKVYGYMSMAQAVSFLNDFKLGHFMKIPPRSMFLVQFIGTILAGTINITVAWWQLTSIKNICQEELLPPNSPWTCPGDRGNQSRFCPMAALVLEFTKYETGSSGWSRPFPLDSGFSIF